MKFEPLTLTAYTTVSALGQGRAAMRDALLHERSGLRACDYTDLATWAGRVAGVEDVSLPQALQTYSCRNNQLAALALETDGYAQAVAAAQARYSAARIGLFLGTSTSGIGATEQAYFDREQNSNELPADFNYLGTHNVYSLADFTRAYLGLNGPAKVISTACSSSAKVFATASRYIRAGWCDAAVVGGVDSLCLTTMYGFASLELISSQPCRPWDIQRDGINVGEAAGFALLERNKDGVALLGYGESADAYHMSTPHPEGEGALLAMQKALSLAQLNTEQIDYINLHGTATPANDRSEDRAVMRLFDNKVAGSSIKGWTGHTLGAAGITEAIASIIAIEEGFLPASLNTQQIDPQLNMSIVQKTTAYPVQTVMSNSFGFGGSNCSLIFGRTSW
ncbi:MAG: beta-ketoacyl-[acyl-carrier-protein] synthase family protein [Thiohalomonadaceae bacterium]